MGDRRRLGLARVIAAAVALGGGAGCHRSATVERPSAASTANATIVVHGIGAEWDAHSVQATRGGNSVTAFDRSSPKFEGRFVDGRLTVGCPLGALCQVGLRHREGAITMFEVVAADPIVAVELSELPRMRGFAAPARVRYVDPDSRSAHLAELLAEELALTQACRGLPAGKCGAVFVLPDPRRVVAGHDPRGAIDRLRAAVTSEDAVLATWAYFSAGCPRAAIDAELARAALREPMDSIASKLWPAGLARAFLAAEGPSGAEARLDRMPSDDGQQDVAAASLIELVHDARARHDLERAATLRDRLRGPGPWTGSPLASRLPADRQVVGIDVGSLSLRTLTGEVRDVAAMKGSPILLYTAASWCKPCADGLPELRTVAQKYPDLVVLYAMFDETEVAAAWVRDHAPIPGTAVVVDEGERTKMEILVGAPALPSFVIIDRDGRVAALPGEDDLDTVVQKSGVLAKR